MRLSCFLFVVMAAATWADTPCACDPAKPETLRARECSLCVEAEKQPADVTVFFVKDINPRKANRMLAVPRFHGPGGHLMSGYTAEQRLAIWSGAIEKAKELWGNAWGIAYNGDRVRTQCHTHVHIGRMLPGVETDNFIVVSSAAEIPMPKIDGFWIHPVDGGKLHVHTGEQINETVLLR